MGIPLSMLPEIRSSLRGVRRRSASAASLAGVPIAGILGDQQAATFGQACLSVGRGQEHLRHRQLHAAQHRHARRCRRKNGLLTTVCYKIGDQRHRSTRSRARSPSPARWCSGCATTSGLIGSAPEIETLAKTVEDNGGAYFVPAFSGPVRAVLARRRPRRDRRPDPVRQQGPHRPRRAGGHRLPDQRGARRDERRLRRRPHRAQGRRRHGRQRDR